MLLILFILLIGIFFFRLLKNETLQEIKRDIFLYVSMFAVFNLFAILILMIFCIFTNPVELKRQHNFSPQIHSIKNSSSIEGRFALGSGYINGSQKYYYFQENIDNDGGLIQCSLPAQNCIIYQTTNYPHVEWDTIYFIPKKWIIWPVLSFTVTKENTNYKIFVPPGTIVEKFEIN